MKKLLSIMASISIFSAATINLVACNKKYTIVIKRWRIFRRIIKRIKRIKRKK